MTIHTLLARVKAGDRQAWEPLCQLVQPHLLRLAQQRLGPTWPQESVSDLVQTTWERALRQIDRFQGGVDEAQTPCIQPGAGQERAQGRQVQLRCNSRT